MTDSTKPHGEQGALATLRELSEKATPGEWRTSSLAHLYLIAENEPTPICSMGEYNRLEGVVDMEFENWKANAAFIVACVNYVRAALRQPSSEAPRQTITGKPLREDEIAVKPIQSNVALAHSSFKGRVVGLSSEAGGESDFSHNKNIRNAEQFKEDVQYIHACHIEGAIDVACREVFERREKAAYEAGRAAGQPEQAREALTQIKDLAERHGGNSWAWDKVREISRAALAAAPPPKE